MYLPAGHGRQEVDPVLSWYDPAEQGTGWSDPAGQ